MAAPRIIDEACVPSGCFPGDRPGFPVEIEEPGSYRFASNLELGSGDPRGVIVLVSNVHIDMDGFAVFGQNHCEWTGESTECELTRWGAAIESIDSADAVSVVNGSIRGIEGDGIALAGEGNRVRDLTVLEVNGNGIAIGGAGTVDGCSVDRAGRTGIHAPTGGSPVLISRSTVSRSTRAFNAGALDNVAARFNGQGITGLPSVIDGSQDEFHVVTP
ncbi:right-handed parallel beta-helix repeat-containing protein [Halomonas denitrificans]|nr:right-handed parallel beta-helix repeat-containing protein [Halomonas denitrificans]